MAPAPNRGSPMTRLIFVLTAILTTPMMSPAQEDAETLYRALEKKLSEAKVLKFDFNAETKNAQGAITMRGTVAVDTENRMRLIFEGTNLGAKSKVTWISDGKKMHLKTELPDKTLQDLRVAHDRLNKIL